MNEAFLLSFSSLIQFRLAKPYIEPPNHRVDLYTLLFSILLVSLSLLALFAPSLSLTSLMASLINRNSDNSYGMTDEQKESSRVDPQTSFARDFIESTS
jgi:hypothetical protein